MSDKELLELAAKAAGIKGEMTDYQNMILIQTDPETVFWNPLHNDGDALRLAVKLDMQVTVDIKGGESWVNHPALPEFVVEEYHGNDPLSATRRAIVRAAAAIGAKL